MPPFCAAPHKAVVPTLGEYLAGFSESMAFTADSTPAANRRQQRSGDFPPSSPAAAMQGARRDKESRNCGSSEPPHKGAVPSFLW
jgi:hypothetical protein